MGWREKQPPKEDTHFLQAAWTYSRVAAFPVITDWYKLRCKPKAPYLHVYITWVRGDSVGCYYSHNGWCELPAACETELQVTPWKKTWQILVSQVCCTENKARSKKKVPSSVKRKTFHAMHVNFNRHKATALKWQINPSAFLLIRLFV